jgi:anthranilate 1,2-dioxygenase large subunit/terephthalate 1,2-dioxygenase oxygenase component alpha subunit
MDIRYNDPVRDIAWPEDSLARVPYWVYQDEANYKREMQRLFEGATWNFVCLEADIPNKGDYRTNQLGDMPVIVVRDADGSINCFENRCAHRGALIAFDDGGNVQNQFKCIYHAWSYDLCGNLRGIAFEKGINGSDGVMRGGMPKDFKRETLQPAQAAHHDLVRAGVRHALARDAADRGYIGSEVLGRIKRVLNRPIRVMGRFVQPLPNNWKLYVENVKDTYHASLLHTFLATFRISRLTQGGGVLVSPDGGSHSSYTIAIPEGANADGLQGPADPHRPGRPLRAGRSQRARVGRGVRRPHPAADPVGVPGFILQQIYNCLAMRHVVPRGVGKMDLVWTYFGFETITPEMNRRRLKQQNLVGPAASSRWRTAASAASCSAAPLAAADHVSVIQMGGNTAESQATRATEASVRGFWKAYRRHMGY